MKVDEKRCIDDVDTNNNDERTVGDRERNIFDDLNQHNNSGRYNMLWYINFKGQDEIFDKINTGADLGFIFCTAKIRHFFLKMMTSSFELVIKL